MLEHQTNCSIITTNVGGGEKNLLHATDRKNNYNQVNSNDNLDLFNI